MFPMFTHLKAQKLAVHCRYSVMPRSSSTQNGNEEMQSHPRQKETRAESTLLLPYSATGSDWTDWNINNVPDNIILFSNFVVASRTSRS